MKTRTTAACCRTSSTACTDCRGPAWPTWSRRFRRRAGRGPPAPRRAASTASTTWAIRPRPVARDPRFAEGVGPGLRSRARARHRRLGAGHQGAAQRAQAAGLERAGRRGARVLPAAHRARERRSDHDGGGAPAHRSAPGAGQRHQQVGRHRRDDGAVPRGAGLAGGGARAGGAPRTSCSPPIRRRARCARSRRAEGIAALDVPPDVGGRFSVLSPVGLLARGAGRASTSRRCSRGARARGASGPRPTTCSQNPAALYAALHWAADTGLGARIHVLMPYTDRLREFAEWYRQLWAESLGKRVDREGRDGPHRADAGGGGRAPPTSTARCSSSWRGRSTR